MLRPAEMSHAKRIQSLFAHWNVLKYMANTIPWPYPANGAREFLEIMLPKVAAREQYYWGIFERAALHEGLMGVISLSPDSDEDNRGFWLGEEFWGRGYMTEANLLVNDFAFDELQMDSLILNNAVPNIGSHRLKEKAGAVLLRIEEREYIGGRFPAAIWRLTRDAWASNRSAFLR